MHKKLLESHDKVSADRVKWQSKLDKLDANSSLLDDFLVIEQKKEQDMVREQVQQAKIKETETQSYINGLEVMNAEMTQECEVVVEGGKQVWKEKQSHFVEKMEQQVDIVVETKELIDICCHQHLQCRSEEKIPVQL